MTLDEAETVAKALAPAAAKQVFRIDVPQDAHPAGPAEPGPAAPRARDPWAALRRAMRRTRAVPVATERLEAALSARRNLSLSFGVLLFMAGFTVDDLRVLRLPGYLVGASLALLAFTIGPPMMARRYAVDHRDEPLSQFVARATMARRVATLVLLLTVLSFLGWLALFSTGVPPWVR